MNRSKKERLQCPAPSCVRSKHTFSDGNFWAHIKRYHKEALERTLARLAMEIVMGEE